MSIAKKERWTEVDLVSLPAGEHDYFERKSGSALDDENRFLATLAKSISAFANSGGGHVLIGINDWGDPDGVDPIAKKPSTRDWLEQKIPHLVDYQLTDYRVHLVEPSSPSAIPRGRCVIAIDIGDSPAAPHQTRFGHGSNKSNVYYIRQGGRSVPAPHFVVSLIFQRLANPELKVNRVVIRPDQILQTDESIFLVLVADFRIENTSSVAAYKWAIVVKEVGIKSDRSVDYVFDRSKFPPGVRTLSGIPMDDTILPGLERTHTWKFGCFLRPIERSRQAILEEVAKLFSDFRMQYVLATETSAGQLQAVDSGESMDLEVIADFVVSELRESMG